MTELAPHEEEFQLACVKFLENERQAHGDANLAFYQGVCALVSIYSAAAVRGGSPETAYRIFAGLQEEATRAISDFRLCTLTDLANG